MKSSVLAFLSTPLLFTISNCLPQGGSGLSNQVPPPPCLYNCIQRYGDCAIGTQDGDASITACYLSTCGSPPDGDNPYAGVYYSSIVPDGGYLSYATDPPHFVVIPPANCGSK